MPSSIHSWKERYFFVRPEQCWGFDPTWGLPQTTANEPPRLTQEEEGARQSLLELGAFKIQDLLSEETLVSAGLSPALAEGRMVGLGALAARARERKGSTSSGADKGKKRSAPEMSEVAATVRPRRGREEVGQEGAAVLIVSPLQERPPPEQAPVRPPARRIRLTTARGTSASVKPQRMAESGAASGATEVPTGSAETPEPGSRLIGGISGGPVLDSPELCLQLLQEFRQRFPQDIQQLEGLVLPCLVDQSYLHAIRGALIADQLCRSLAKAEGDRDILRLRLSELEAKEQEGGTWEAKVREAEEKVEEIEGGLRVAKEVARVAEERRSLSDQRANAAEEQVLQAESKIKAAEEKCQRADEKSRELIKQAKQVESRMHLAEASLLARELELKDARAQLGGLTAELGNARVELGRKEARAEDGWAKLSAVQADVDRLQEEAGGLRSALSRAEEKAVKAEAEALDSLTDAYLQGFGNCKRQVGKLLPELDLSGLDEGDVGEEAGDRPAESEDGQTEKGEEDEQKREGEAVVSGQSSEGTAEPGPGVIAVSPPTDEVGPDVVE